MNELLQKIHDIGIIPVIAIDDASKAVPLARALVAGGLPAAEVTFRTAAAEEAICSIRSEVPEMLVGAGTVLTKEQADRAIAAGVSFIVSPGFNPEMVRYVLDKKVSVLPGTATPGEMEQAMSMGLEAVKFFPAEQNGGIAMLRAIASGPRPQPGRPTGERSRPASASRSGPRSSLNRSSRRRSGPSRPIHGMRVPASAASASRSASKPWCMTSASGLAWRSFSGVRPYWW